MDISELIGFVISLLAFAFLMFRRALSRRNEDPQEEIDQDKRLKDFLRSLDIEMKGDEEEEPVRLPPPPPPAPKPNPPVITPQPQARFDYSLNNRLEGYKTQSAIETRKLQTSSHYGENDYHAIQREKPSRARRILYSLNSPGDIIVLHEILTRRY